MRRSLLPFAVLLLAACSGGNAPPAGPPLGDVTPVETPRIFGLLGEREELGLSSAQVTSLDSIAEALRRSNAPVEDSLRAFYERRGRPRSVGAQREMMRESLPLLEQAWANNRRAMDAVRDVLAPAQREKVCQGQQRRGERREEMMRDRDTRPRTIRRMDPDSVEARTIRGWSWCPQATRAAPGAARPGAQRPDSVRPGTARPDSVRPDTVRRP